MSDQNLPPDANMPDDMLENEAQLSVDLPTDDNALPSDDAALVDDNLPLEDISQTDDFEQGAGVLDVTEVVESDSFRNIEDLTISELISQFIQQPRTTWRVFSNVLKPSERDAASDASSDNLRLEVRDADEAPIIMRGIFGVFAFILIIISGGSMPVESGNGDEEAGEKPSVSLRQLMLSARESGNARQRLQLTFYLIAFFIACVGTGWLINAPSRTEENGLVVGAPAMLAGFIIWLLADLIGFWPRLQGWWSALLRQEKGIWFARAIPLAFILNGIYLLVRSTDASPETLFTYTTPALQFLTGGAVLWLVLDIIRGQLIAREKRKNKETQTGESLIPAPANMPWYKTLHPARIVLAGTGFLLAIGLWQTLSSYENTMPGLSWLVWLISVACVALAFVPQDFNPPAGFSQTIDRLRRLKFANMVLPILIFAGTMLLAANFRLDRLTGINSIPPEMTSDHVEKILDSNKVAQGDRSIFFANNGGREPFQMYAIAFFAQVTGHNMSHDTIKLVAAIEGLLTIPILFLFAVEILGREDKRRGILAGLVITALVAVSYWHTSVTRLALRIVLTPLIASLLLIYLSRGLRDNTRMDFIKAGLVLGFGLYTYQAVRMLPVVIVVGVVMALYMVARNWRDWWRYTVNLTVLVLISFMCFLPLFNYSVQHPDAFWKRTTGRILGDDIITEVDETGTLVERNATLQERVEAFNANLPILMNNLRNAVLMFNWKGDVAWINGYPNHPALDQYTGALFIIGLAAWLSLMLRRRDVAIWLMPVMIFIMLLPSALSIAYPIENPSFTRTSGSLPAVYLIASLPAVLIIEHILKLIPGNRGKAVAIGGSLIIVLLAYSVNQRIYFNDFVRAYERPSLPYSDAGQVLHGFAISGGSYGNAYMIAYPFWWDHRALGLAAGVTDWPNGIVTLDNVPDFLQQAYEKPPGDPYRLDPSRDLLFFFAPVDEVTEAQLAAWFPNGYSRLETTYQIDDDFMLFRVPAPGEAGLLEFFADAPNQLLDE